MAFPLKNVTNVVMMNKGHLEEAGLEIPAEWTWDEYREYAKAIRLTNIMDRISIFGIKPFLIIEISK